MIQSNATVKDSTKAILDAGLGLPHFNHIARFAKERTLRYREWKPDIAAVSDQVIWKDIITTYETSNSLRNNVMHGISKTVVAGRVFISGGLVRFGVLDRNNQVQFDESLGEPYRVAYFSFLSMCANVHQANFKRPYQELLKDRTSQLYVLNAILNNTRDKMIEHGIKNTV